MQSEDKYMDVEERISIERRMGHIEKELATQASLLARNAQILDDIRQYINEPKRTPEWIAAVIAVLVLCGGVLYAAYIAPLTDRTTKLEAEVESLDRRADIIDKDHLMSQQMFREAWQKLKTENEPL